jgi:hypothetical protein
VFPGYRIPAQPDRTGPAELAADEAILNARR